MNIIFFGGWGGGGLREGYLFGYEDFVSFGLRSLHNGAFWGILFM